MSALVQSLLDQAKIDAETIQANDLKIQGLSLELAHLRRIRYGVKNEALSSMQSDFYLSAYVRNRTDRGRFNGYPQ